MASKGGFTNMNRWLPPAGRAALAGCVLFASAAAQVLPSAPRAAKVEITQGPEVERADADFAIIRWTSNNPGGSDQHYAVIYYGTGPANLNQMARSPVRLNRTHSYTIFRVRMPGLKPNTTYYYRVDSAQAGGSSDRVSSPLRHFTTPHR
jgi:phosphodiesterase/alkaline phosphatase D-like protein